MMGKSQLYRILKIAFLSLLLIRITNSAGLINDDNVCLIRPNIHQPRSNDFIGDVAKIRILAKAGNDGASLLLMKLTPLKLNKEHIWI